MIERGADVNLYGYAYTPLMTAADYGRVDIVKILLDAGANPNDRIGGRSWYSNRGGTAMFIGADYQCSNIKRAGDGSVKGKTREDAVKEQAAIIKMLSGGGADLNIQRNEDGKTALMVSCLSAVPWGYGDISLVRMMIECGADRNIRDKDGNTALMLTEKRGSGYDKIKALLKE